MYEVDARDRVVPLADFPPSSVGAPLPLVIADEHRVAVAFLLQDYDPAWDGTSTRVVGATSSDESVGVAKFEPHHAMMFGPPNDEAFSGHPLADRGLEPYGAFEVVESSWIRRLERMNRVHPWHTPALYAKRRHFVITFHDSTFECVAQRYEVEITKGSIEEQAPAMLRWLQQ